MAWPRVGSKVASNTPLRPTIRMSRSIRARFTSKTGRYVLTAAATELQAQFAWAAVAAGSRHFPVAVDNSSRVADRMPYIVICIVSRECPGRRGDALCIARPDRYF